MTNPSMPPAVSVRSHSPGCRHVVGLLAQHNRGGQSGQGPLQHGSTLPERLISQILTVCGKDVEGDELRRLLRSDGPDSPAGGSAACRTGEVQSASCGVPDDQLPVEHQVNRQSSGQHWCQVWEQWREVRAVA